MSYWKRLRRILIGLVLLGLLLCLLLVLNVTAPNPTHRRSSSQIPTTTGEGSSQDIGLSGEEILALDLGVPRNDLSEERICICGTERDAPPSECNSCLLQLDSVVAYRRPDFVAGSYIAEAKNRRALLASQSDLAQIRDYAEAAQELQVPLWLFVRVDSLVDPAYIDIVQSTGGDVVYYFATPGFTDSVTSSAALGSVFFLVIGVGVVGIRYLRLPAIPTRKPRHRRSPAESSVENAREYVERVKTRSDR